MSTHDYILNLSFKIYVYFFKKGKEAPAFITI